MNLVLQTFLLVLALMLAMPVAVADTAGAPDQLVSNTAGRILSQINANYDSYSENPALLGEVVRADMLPPDIGSIAPTAPLADAGTEMMSLPLREARGIFERRYLEAQVMRFGGNISRTASFIGMERSALHRKLRSLGINAPERQ